MVTWLAIVADAVALTWLFRSQQPSLFKEIAGGIDLLGLYTIVVFYLGRRWEWLRVADHLRRSSRKAPLDEASERRTARAARQQAPPDAEAA